VVTVSGEIVDGDAGPGRAGGTRIADLIDQAVASETTARWWSASTAPAAR
jgi:hypothetical protein